MSFIKSYFILNKIIKIFFLFLPHVYFVRNLSVQFFNCSSTLERAHFEQLQRYFITCYHFSSHSVLWRHAYKKTGLLLLPGKYRLWHQLCRSCYFSPVCDYTGDALRIIFEFQVLDSTDSLFLTDEFAQDLVYSIQFQ